MLPLPLYQIGSRFFPSFLFERPRIIPSAAPLFLSPFLSRRYSYPHLLHLLCVLSSPQHLSLCLFPSQVYTPIRTVRVICVRLCLNTGTCCPLARLPACLPARATSPSARASLSLSLRCTLYTLYARHSSVGTDVGSSASSSRRVLYVSCVSVRGCACACNTIYICVRQRGGLSVVYIIHTAHYLRAPASQYAAAPFRVRRDRLHCARVRASCVRIYIYVRTCASLKNLVVQSRTSCERREARVSRCRG